MDDARTTGVPFETVLAAAQSGAEWASATLWREYAPSVVGFARGRGSKDPDDLASEVFLSVFDTLSTFIGSESEFRSFLFSIAYRRVVDELRQRSRRGESVQWQPENDLRSEPSAEDAANLRSSDQSVLALFDFLPVDQRNVMVLRIVSDLTIEQIAEVLDKTPGAVKSLQKRALDALRKKVLTKPYPSRPLERLPV
ncbi:sigma-70 family RNA polymerase sigma factor [Salinibacterium sp.]|uniref:RNA polymerase sigma factor n=1 Tax=Salinibacterium sp. TaxID=1915057 RepID=UPI00286CCD48|nr:sigma-70 family RNA polymerase sigma factor [Salinibacterium sp.]